MQKKLLLIVAALAFVISIYNFGLYGVSRAATSSLIIISPNGGESYPGGSKLPIHFKYSGTERVTIDLIPNNCGVCSYRLVSNYILPVGETETTFEWPIDVNVIPGNSYKIFISGGIAQDYSDNYFSIVGSALTCRDDDGGKKYDQPGTTRGALDGPAPAQGNVFLKAGWIYGENRNKYSSRFDASLGESIYNDQCVDSGTSQDLYEAYCSPSGFVTPRRIICPFGCKDGACIIPSSIDFAVSNLRVVKEAGSTTAFFDLIYTGTQSYKGELPITWFIDNESWGNFTAEPGRIFDHDPLMPGKITVINSYYTFPTLSYGRHYVKVVIDPDDGFRETNESNNQSVILVESTSQGINQVSDTSTTRPNSTEVQQIIERIRKLEYKISQLEQKVVETERALAKAIDTALTNRLKGRILLQVEENGEAWYVDEVTDQKFYLKDGNTAYQALKAFGLGITSKDLEKIPVGFEDRFEDVDTDSDGLSDKIEEALGTDPNNPDSDGDGFKDGEEVRGGFNPLDLGRSANDTSLANRLKGKILLQIDSRGEAWYIHPENGKRYYMKDGPAAYQIMRFLSLGITNNDLRKIDVGSFE